MYVLPILNPKSVICSVRGGQGSYLVLTLSRVRDTSRQPSLWRHALLKTSHSGMGGDSCWKSWKSNTETQTMMTDENRTSKYHYQLFMLTETYLPGVTEAWYWFEGSMLMAAAHTPVSYPPTFTLLRPKCNLAFANGGVMARWYAWLNRAWGDRGEAGTDLRFMLVTSSSSTVPLCPPLCKITTLDTAVSY